MMNVIDTAVVPVSLMIAEDVIRGALVALLTLEQEGRRRSRSRSLGSVKPSVLAQLSETVPEPVFARNRQTNPGHVAIGLPGAAVEYAEAMGVWVEREVTCPPGTGGGYCHGEGEGLGRRLADAVLREGGPLDCIRARRFPQWREHGGAALGRDFSPESLDALHCDGGTGGVVVPVSELADTFKHHEVGSLRRSHHHRVN